MPPLLSNFAPHSHAVVIGASGGIGSAFVDHLNAQPNIAKIHTFSRSQNGFDLMDEATIEAAAKTIEDRSIHLIIIATGHLGLTPEKSLKDLSAEQMNHIMGINTIGPALVMKHFAAKLSRDEKSVMAALSARVGSISDNQLGGWYSYRAAKAALNMMIKNTAIEIERTNKNTCIIGLHPGTVDTDLSKPFQSHVPEHNLFTTAYATEKMLGVVNSVTPQDSGFLFAYDGEKIPF